jgi:hypothetical protein
MSWLRALQRWAGFLWLVHGRSQLRIRQRTPAVFGDQRHRFPDHYPTRAGQLTAARTHSHGD